MVWGTYELGIVFVLTDGRGVTPAFPFRGGDNYDGTLTYTTTNITDPSGFLNNSTENRLGIYRTKAGRKMLTGGSKTEIRHLRVDVTPLQTSAFIQQNTLGFFIVRKERKKDCIVQGFLTNTVREPNKTTNTNTIDYFERTTTKPFWDTEKALIKPILNDLGASIPDLTLLQQQAQFVPAPGRIIEFSSSGYKTHTAQGKVLPGETINGTNTMSPGEHRYAFYAADALVDPPLFASVFNDSNKGLMINANPVYAKQDLTSNPFNTQQWSITSVIDFVGTAITGDETVRIYYSPTNITWDNFFNNDLTTPTYTTVFNFDPTTNILTVTVPVRVECVGGILGGKSVTTIADVMLDISTPATVTGSLTISDNIAPGNDINIIGGTTNIITLQGNPFVSGNAPNLFFDDINIVVYDNTISPSFSVAVNTLGIVTQTQTLNGVAQEVSALNLLDYSFLPQNLVASPGRNTKMLYIPDTQRSYSDNQFAAISDRNIFYGVGRVANNPYVLFDVNVANIRMDLMGWNATQYSDYTGVLMTEGDPTLSSA